MSTLRMYLWALHVWTVSSTHYTALPGSSAFVFICVKSSYPPRTKRTAYLANLPVCSMTKPSARFSYPTNRTTTSLPSNSPCQSSKPTMGFLSAAQRSAASCLSRSVELHWLVIRVWCIQTWYTVSGSSSGWLMRHAVLFEHALVICSGNAPTIELVRDGVASLVDIAVHFAGHHCVERVVCLCDMNGCWGG